MAAASASASSLDPASPLALLLQTVPQSTRHTLDFSGLDPITYAVLCDAATQSAQEKAQDAELRMALTSKNRILETKLERAHREHGDALADVDAAKRGQDQAKAALAAAQAQVEVAEATKKNAMQDLAKARRDSQAVKVAARQTKLSNERSIARQRERFSDAAILATRNASSTLVTVPSVFDAPLASSSTSSLYAQQAAELEAQRSALLSANSALRRLFTEALNALNDLSASIANPSTSSVPARALQSDLFPKGMALSKGYDLASSRNSSSASIHPAVRALSQAIGAGELAVHEWEGERRQLKETLKASQSAAAAAAPTDAEEAAIAAANAPRKGPSRIALAASTSASSAAASATAHAEQQRQIQALKTRLAERDAEVRRIEERLDEALRESDGAAARMAQAEERVQEIEAMRQREMEEMAKEKERDAARAAAARPVVKAVHGDESMTEQSSLSFALEPLSATKKTRARRMQVDLPPPVADEVVLDEQDGPASASSAPSSGPSTSSSSLKRSHEQEAAAAPAEDGTFSLTVPSEAEMADERAEAEQSSTSTSTSKRARRSADPASNVNASSKLSASTSPTTAPPQQSQQQQQQQRRVLSGRAVPNSSGSGGSRVPSSSLTSTKTKSSAVPMSSTPAAPIRKMVSAATKKRQEQQQAAAGEREAEAEAVTTTPAPPAAAATAAAKKRTVATPSVLQAALERRRRGGGAEGGRRTVSGGR